MIDKLFRGLPALVLLIPAAAMAAEVNLYSARKEALIKPLLDRFTEQSGIKVNLVTGKADALLKRLKSEGANSPADLLITTDAGRLHRAKVAGLLQPIDSSLLTQAIPENYRDPEGYWFGLSVRARVILYAKGRVDPAELSSYEALADPRWQKRICIRSSNNIYNQSLVASAIATRGAEATQAWATGLVKNFARRPKGGDRDQVKAAATGLCDLAVINTYYFGQMIHGKDEKQRQAAASMALFWPNQADRGTHVNISGAGVTRAARHPQEARRLLEYLAGESAQQWYAEANFEYPVRAGVSWPDTLKAWGDFKADSINLSLLGEHNPEAVRIMDRAGWR